MRFEFEPRHTRSAVMQIAQLFGDGGRTPLGLEDMFERLRRMDNETLIRFAQHASQGEIDSLCAYYHRAKHVNTLVALTMVLCFRSDRRWSDVARFMFFQMPPQEQLERIRQIWSSLSPDLPRPVDMQWLTAYLEMLTPPAPLDYVIAEIRRSRFPIENLNESFFRTPLFGHLLDFLFAEGGPLLARLQDAPANDRVSTYLAAGDQLRVRGYLSYYPPVKWQPGFLEKLYATFGRPDASASDFYKRLDEPVLWSVRGQLFRARMSDSPSPKAQQVFWMDRIHRCQDWSYQDGVATILVYPLKFIEKLERTEVFHTHQDDTVIARIAHDHGFNGAVDALFTKYFGW